MKLGKLNFDKMGLMTFSILLLLVISGFNTGLVSGETFSSYDGMEKEEKYWKPELWGSVSTSTEFVNEGFESDSDVDSVLDYSSDGVNSMYLENNNSRIENQVIDVTETSLGKHTTDWTGTVGSTTDDATGGNYYWLPNATSSPSSTNGAGTDDFTISQTLATPSSSGYKMTASTTYDAESTENGDTDRNSNNFVMSGIGDFSGVDTELSANSYVLINVAFKLSAINTTAEQGMGIFFVIETSGGSHVTVAINYGSGYSTTSGFIDQSTAATPSYMVKTTDEDVVRYSIDAISTDTSEIVLLKKVDDLLDVSSTYSSDSPSRLAEWGYWFQSKYSSSSTNSGTSTGTITLNNLLFVDTVNDLSMYEDTGSDDTSTQQSDNWINGTSMTLSDSDKYSITNGYSFALDVPINRLTLSSFDYIIEPSSHEILYGLDGGYDNDGMFGRTSTFNTKVSSEEPFSKPTLTANFSNIDDNSYLHDLVFDSEDMFEEDGDMRAGWSMTDGTSFDEISDVYYADLSGDIKITPKTTIGSESTYQVEVILDVGESAVNSLVADKQGGALDNFWDWVLSIFAGLGIVAAGSSLRSRKIDRANQ